MKKSKKLFFAALLIFAAIASVSVYASIALEVVLTYYEVDDKGKVIGLYKGDSSAFDLNQSVKFLFPDGVTREIKGLPYTVPMTEYIAGEINDNYRFYQFPEDRVQLAAPFHVSDMLNPAGTHTILSYPVPNGYVAADTKSLTFVLEYENGYNITQACQNTWEIDVYIKKSGAGSAPATPTTPAKTSPSVMSNINVYISGKKVSLTKPILNAGDRTFYPFRECFELLGATVDWNAQTRAASAKTGNSANVSFTVDSNKYSSGTNTLEMDEGLTAFLNENSLYVPIRYAAEGLGFTVTWDAASNTMRID